MAKVKRGEKTLTVEDGEQIRDAALELGVLFGCRSGLCGSCEVRVVEGMNNLSEKNELEKDMDLEVGKRLACQCRILKGEVVIEQD